MSATSNRFGNTLLTSGFFPPARVATIGANINLSGLQVLDGVQLADGDRVLVKNQTQPYLNGIYAASSGPWVRTTDAATNGRFLAGMCVGVAFGTVNRGTVWRCSSEDDPVVVGASDITFEALQVIVPVAVPPGGRTKLLVPTTFYVTTTGDNVTGDGSAASPWATCGGAYRALQASYDLGGQIVTVMVADGTYTEGCDASGAIVGQSGSTGLRFIGNLSDPSACIIRPTNGYSFGAAFGARFAVSGFKSDHYGGGNSNTGLGPGDMISVGQGGEIWIINPNPGSIAHCYTFGTSAGIGYNDMSAAFGGQIFIDTWVKYKIDSTDDAVSTTATWTSGAGTITIADVTNVREGMAVRGTGIHPLSYISTLVGNVATLNGAGTFASKTNEPITLTMSRQNHADVGVRGAIIHNTNGTPGYNAVELIGNPHYNVSFILSNGSGAQASFQTIAFTGTCTGAPFIARALGSVDTLANLNDPATYLPGTRTTKVCSFLGLASHIVLPSNGALPQWGDEVMPGMMVCGPGIRSPADPSFATATSEHTIIEYFNGVATDVVLNRPTQTAQTNVTLTFVGYIGQGGQYI